MFEVHISTSAPVPYAWPNEVARAIRIVTILMLLVCWFALVGMAAGAEALRGALLDSPPAG